MLLVVIQFFPLLC